MTVTRDQLRTHVRVTYDYQKLRIQAGNRIVQSFRRKLGQEPGTKTEDMDDEAQKLLQILRAEYGRVADGVANLTRRSRITGTEMLQTPTEVGMVGAFVDMEKHERQLFKVLEWMLADFPIHEAHLAGVKGCGPAMSAVVIAEIDITKARYASSIWKYAGLDVAPDGRGRSRRKEHLVERDYVDKDGNEAKRNGITFNPFLKTKLIGVLGPCLIKAGGEYAQVYRDYKHRLEHRPDLAEESKGRRHNMAVRYMVKRFLADLYSAWRELEGLPVEPEYAEGKLGIRHGGIAA